MNKTKILLTRVLLVALMPLTLGCIQEGDGLVRISAKEEDFAYQVVEAKDDVWFAMDSGAYRLDRDTPSPVLSNLLVKTIAEVYDQVWIGSEKGLFQVEGDNAVPIFRDSTGEIMITVIERQADAVWLGTQKGLFFLEGEASEGFKEISEVRGTVYDIELIEDQVYVASSRNAYRISDDGSVSEVVRTKPTTVSRIFKAGDFVWLITNTDLGRYGPVLRLEDDSVREILKDHQVISGAQVGSEVWFGTTDGAYRLIPGSTELVPISGIAEPVNFITTIWEETWIGTTRRVFRGSGAEFQRVPASEQINVKGIVGAEGQIWIWSNNGVYRLGKDSRLSFAVPVVFRALIRPVVLIAICWLAAAAVIIGFSPWCRPCMDFIMNPALRRSLLAISVAMTFSAVRGHLLRRYQGQLSTWLGSDDAIRDTALGFRSGEALEAVRSSLVRRNTVVVLGPVESTGRLLRALLMWFISQKAGRLPLRGGIPVFFPLEILPSSATEDDIRKGVISQIVAYGGVVDVGLAGSFFDHGGFIVMFNGFGRLGEQGRSAVKQFVFANRAHNRIILASDEKYEEFSELEAIEYIDLSELLYLEVPLDEHVSPPPRVVREWQEGGVARTSPLRRPSSAGSEAPTAELAITLRLSRPELDVASFIRDLSMTLDSSDNSITIVEIAERRLVLRFQKSALLVELLDRYYGGDLDLSLVLERYKVERIEHRLVVPRAASQEAVEDMVSRESRFGKKHVLVSYSYVDIKDVVRLRENLITAGEQVWWEKDILPGENSKMASRKAIENSYAVVLCLSKDSVSRPRSKLYDEALQAIAAYREYRPDSIFLIPVRLSECEVPNLEIDSNNTLRCLQYVDLFPSSQRENGLNSLLRALREAPLHPLRIGEAIVEE